MRLKSVGSGYIPARLRKAAELAGLEQVLNDLRIVTEALKNMNLRSDRRG
jgi:hypothetical protein